MTGQLGVELAGQHAAPPRGRQEGTAVLHVLAEFVQPLPLLVRERPHAARAADARLVVGVAEVLGREGAPAAMALLVGAWREFAFGTIRVTLPASMATKLLTSSVCRNAR